MSMLRGCSVNLRVICSFLIFVLVENVYCVDPVANFGLTLELQKEYDRLLGLEVYPIEGSGKWGVAGTGIENDIGNSGFLIILNGSGAVEHSAILPVEMAGSKIIPDRSGDRIISSVSNFEVSQVGVGMHEINGFDILYSKRVVLDGDGRAILLSDRESGFALLVEVDRQIYLESVNGNGDVSWSRKIESSEFSTSGTGLLGILEGFSVSNGYVVSLVQSKRGPSPDGFGTTRTMFILRIDDSGNLMWSRKLQSFEMLPTIDHDSEGNLYIVAVREDRLQSGILKKTTHVMKINNEGSAEWSRIVEGGGYHLAGSLDGDKVLLMNSGSSFGKRNVSKYVILNQGIIEAGFEIFYSNEGSSYAFTEGGRMWFKMDAYRLGDPEGRSRRTTAFGWIEESLENSRWLQYGRGTLFSKLVNAEDSQDILFAAISPDNKNIDCVSIERNFDEGSSDGLFQLVDILVNKVDVLDAPFEWGLTEFDASVIDRSINLEPGLQSPQALHFSTVNIQDDFDFNNRIPEEINIPDYRITDDYLLIQYPTRAGSEYVFESGYRFGDRFSWSERERFAGTGFQEYLVTSFYDDQIFVRIRALK